MILEYLAALLHTHSHANKQVPKGRNCFLNSQDEQDMILAMKQGTIFCLLQRVLQFRRKYFSMKLYLRKYNTLTGNKCSTSIQGVCVLDCKSKYLQPLQAITEHTGIKPINATITCII